MIPKNRSRSVKRVFVRTPSGRRTTHFKRKRGKRVLCRICGRVLGGVRNVRGIAASEKVPERIFAGTLCAGCTSELVALKARLEAGEQKIQLSLAQRDFLRQMGVNV